MDKGTARAAEALSEEQVRVASVIMTIVDGACVLTDLLLESTGWALGECEAVAYRYVALQYLEKDGLMMRAAEQMLAWERERQCGQAPRELEWPEFVADRYALVAQAQREHQRIYELEPCFIRDWAIGMGA